MLGTDESRGDLPEREERTGFERFYKLLQGFVFFHFKRNRKPLKSFVQKSDRIQLTVKRITVVAVSRRE